MPSRKRCHDSRVDDMLYLVEQVFGYTPGYGAKQLHETTRQPTTKWKLAIVKWQSGGACMQRTQSSPLKQQIRWSRMICKIGCSSAQALA